MLGNHRRPQLGGGLKPMTQQPAAPTQPTAQMTEPAERPRPATGGLLTPAQAAERLGVGERVLERWRSTGDGPVYVRLTRRMLRYRAEDLAAFVAGSLRRSTAG